MLRMKNRFIFGPNIKMPNYSYRNCNSYTEYNYLKPGLSTLLKRRPLEIVLQLTSHFFNKVNVIDYGCGDGPLIPSESKYYKNTVGIDINPKFIEYAKMVKKVANLKNITLICNQNKSINEIKKLMPKKKYQILLLIEILEHIGLNWKSMYTNKILFLRKIRKLIEPKGLIIITVPKMTGISLFLQKIRSFFFKVEALNIPFSDFLKSVFLSYSTTNLEKLWNPSLHIGFNEKKLESYLKIDFDLVYKYSELFTQVFVLKSKAN